MTTRANCNFSVFGNYGPRTAPLNRIEQAHLHNKMQQGDKNARETIICSCLPLVISIAQNFRSNNRHIEMEDFVQEGSIALIKAVDSWDINKGSITTVATWYIKSAFVDMINDAKYTIKYPYSLSRRAANELRKVKSLNSDNVEYIVEKTGLSHKRVKTLLHISPKGTQRVTLGHGYGCRGRSVRNIQDDLRRFTGMADCRDNEESRMKPCMGDLIELINRNLSGDHKTIFCLWAGISKKKMGPKAIAQSIGKSEQYVYNSIYSSKRILSRLAKKAHNHA